MQEILEFAIVVVLISASGVMAPGPLFASCVSHGLRGGARAGLKMAYGHTLVELPLVVLIGVGAFSLESLPQFREAIALLGAASLFVFAGLQIRSVLKKPSTVFEGKHGPFLAGIILSALNPFFLVWWFTIGFKLISDSLLLASFWGIGIMFLYHIWMDYAWLGFIGFVSSRGGKILSSKNYKILMIGLSGVLIYFGATFALEAIS
ncbi:MAG: LysE family transporter [Nitrosopumilaceae archaeon]